jgi:hypothetical protein
MELSSSKIATYGACTGKNFVTPSHSEGKRIMRPIKRQILDDRLFLLRARALRKPCFHGGLDSPPLAEHLRALDFELPRLGRPGRFAFKAESLVGSVGAAIHLYVQGADDAPVLIYHHAGGEVPATSALRDIYPSPHRAGLTILAVEAPYHETSRQFEAANGSMLTFLTMQAVAIEATERLLQSPALSEAPLRVVAGYGQGGFVANLHHLHYDTANIYIPLMAGTAQAEPFLDALPTASRVRHKPDALRQLLNFDAEWAKREHRNVFPVLGCADLVNRFDTQSRSYAATPIEVWPLSHRAGAKAPERIRAKITWQVEAALDERRVAREARTVHHLERARLRRARG